MSKRKYVRKVPPLMDPMLEKEFLENCHSIEDFFNRLGKTTMNFTRGFWKTMILRLFPKFSYCYNKYVVIYSGSHYTEPKFVHVPYNLDRNYMRHKDILYVYVDGKRFAFYTLHDMFIR